MKENGSTDAKMTRNFRSRSIRTDKEIIKFCPHSFVLIFPGPCYVRPVALTDRQSMFGRRKWWSTFIIAIFSLFPISFLRSFPLTFSDRFRLVQCPLAAEHKHEFIWTETTSIPTSIHPSHIITFSIFHLPLIRYAVSSFAEERICEFAHSARFNIIH